MLRQLSCRDICKIMAWLDRWNTNYSEENHMNQFEYTHGGIVITQFCSSVCPFVSLCVLFGENMSQTMAINLSKFVTLTYFSWSLLLNNKGRGELHAPREFLLCYRDYWGSYTSPDSKIHGANMGPIWGRQDPGGPHVGPVNFTVWGSSRSSTQLTILSHLIIASWQHYNPKTTWKMFQAVGWHLSPIRTLIYKNIHPTNRPKSRFCTICPFCPVSNVSIP